MKRGNLRATLKTGGAGVLAVVLAASLAPGAALAAEPSSVSSAAAASASEAEGSLQEPALVEVVEPAAADPTADAATAGATAAEGAGEAGESLQTLAEEGEELDFYNLPDGLYSVYAEMYKMNARDHSMSNEAVNHTMKLEVENGVYYLTLDFRGIAMNSMFGYLGKLWYYADGYTISGGAVYGDLLEGEVLSVQTNADGSTLTDEYSQFNSYEPYPNQVRIEYVPTAINDEDGFVALRVFVPVMESISAGMGTQDVLAWIDKASVAVAEEDEFVDNESDPGDLLSTTTGTTTPSTIGTTTSSTIGSTASGSTVKSSTLAQTGDATAALAFVAAGLAGAGVLALGASRRRMASEMASGDLETEERS